MKRFLSLLLLTILLIASCKTRSAKVESAIKIIDVAGAVGKGQIVPLSQIGESIEYIPLETKQNTLVDKISWHSIVYENNKFYIKYNHSLFVFDNSGKFLFNFNRYGRGPQEYDHLSDFCIDPDDNIIVRGIERFIMYDKSGNFVKVLADKNFIPGVVLKKCYPLGKERYLFITDLRRGADNEFSAIIMDLKSDKITKIKYPQKEREFVKSLPAMYRYTFYEVTALRSADGILLINGLDESVLRIDKNLNIDTLFNFNFGKHHPRDIPGGLFDRGGGSSVVYRYMLPLESTTYIFDQFKLGSSAHKPREMLKGGDNPNNETYTSDISCSLFNKKTGEFIFVDQPEVNQIGFPDDFEGGPAVWPLYVSTSNQMVSFINAFNLITYAETHNVSAKFKEIAGRIKETDNPVLILVTLKK